MKTKLLKISHYKNRRDYILFDNDCGVSDVARNGGIYENYIFDYIKNNNINLDNTNVIDIGANFGFHTIEFAHLLNNGHVHSFEPQRLIFYQLCGNVILNRLDNVYCYHNAIGNENKDVLIENPNYYSEGVINIGNAHIDFNVDHCHTVAMKRIDDYNFHDISIIKIDVQGYEYYVLDGAEQTILKNKPVIFIEIEEPQLSIYGFKSKDIFSQLQKLGYKYHKLHPDNHIVDYVAIPDKNYE